MSGVLCLVFGVLVFGVWCFGVWGLVFVVWCLVFGVWGRTQGSGFGLRIEPILSRTDSPVDLRSSLVRSVFGLWGFLGETTPRDRRVRGSLGTSPMYS